MDYRRLYWLCFLVSGIIYALLNLADYTAGGATTDLLLAGAGGVIGIVSGFGVYDPDRAGGPEELGPRFAVAVVALLLFLGLAVQRLLGG